MSRLDQDREDLIRLIISICDYARLGYKVSTYKNCNNCGRKECQFKPDWGKDVRWNCPLAERKPGKWILADAYAGKRYRCSECLAFALKTDDGRENLSDYCPVCGARLGGEDDGTD